jgi:uncharacterized membrane protein
MGSPASIAKHPLHPMLVPFPIALWIFSFIGDAVYLFGWGDEVWPRIALYAMVGGTVGALAAAVPGYLDWRSITDPQTKRIGLAHMLLNLIIVGLYVVNVLLRATGATSLLLPILLSAAAILLLGVSGWLGGELVYVHGVSVEPQAPRPGGKA